MAKSATAALETPPAAERPRVGSVVALLLPNGTITDATAYGLVPTDDPDHPKLHLQYANDAGRATTAMFVQHSPGQPRCWATTPIEHERARLAADPFEVARARGERIPTVGERVLTLVEDPGDVVRFRAEVAYVVAVQLPQQLRIKVVHDDNNPDSRILRQFTARHGFHGGGWLFTDEEALIPPPRPRFPDRSCSKCGIPSSLLHELYAGENVRLIDECTRRHYWREPLARMCDACLSEFVAEVAPRYRLEPRGVPAT